MNHRLPLAFVAAPCIRPAALAAPRHTRSEQPAGGNGGRPDGFLVSSGMNRPDAALAAIRYEDRGFSIQGRTLSSKRVLSLMMVLLVLSETGDTVARAALPISTAPQAGAIPVGVA